MGFADTGYARLLDAAHQQLGGPVVLVWNNRNTHVSRSMCERVQYHPRLIEGPITKSGLDLQPP